MMEQADRGNAADVETPGSERDSKADDKEDAKAGKEESQPASKGNKTKEEGNGKEKEKSDAKEKKMAKLNDDAIVFMRKRSAADTARYAGSLRSIMDLQRKRQRANEARLCAARPRGTYVTCRKCAQRLGSGHREDKAGEQTGPGGRLASGSRSRDCSPSNMSCESETDDAPEGRREKRASANRSESMEPGDACRRKRKKKKKRCPRKRKPRCPKKKRKCCRKPCCKRSCMKKKRKKRC